MTILISLIGLILIAASVALQNQPTQLRQYAGQLRIAGLAIVAVGIFSSAIKQIEAGQVGVVTIFGKTEPNTIESGLHLVNPIAQIIPFDIKTQNYTMSSIHDEGDQTGDDAIRVLTADGLEVVVDLTVLYRVIPNEAPRIYREIGKNYQYTVIRPIARTKIRDNAVYYEAVALYSTKRDEFQARIFKDIETNFKVRGLVLEQLLVRNITLPTSVKASIESKINAEQDAQKMQFVLQKEKQEAERKRVEAQGIADYQKIISTQLSDKQLQYEQIKAMKEIATSPNTKVIMMGGGKNQVILGGN
jgi:regulator of protease activity HflC (stomatin/prohibitin superfamily)